jgi:hypothetical protein
MYFEIDGQTVWNPAVTVGRLYLQYLDAIERELGLAAGAQVSDSDEIHFDAAKFGPFVAELARRYTSSDHRVLREQLGVVLFPALVMLQRGNYGVAVSDETELTTRAAAFGSGMPA